MVSLVPLKGRSDKPTSMILSIPSPEENALSSMHVLLCCSKERREEAKPSQQLTEEVLPRAAHCLCLLIASITYNLSTLSAKGRHVNLMDKSEFQFTTTIS